jgi:catechol 2,3-dioxygenase-like lactoylglutathione lyase family enzyme
MLNPIRTIRVNHINVVLEDYDATVEHYERLFGGELVLDLPQATWHACLMDVGRVIFELFMPNEFFLHTRYGPHFIGIEYQVEDLDGAREVLAERGIRVARELGVALHSNPADCHGVSLELFGGYFHDNDEVLQKKMESPAYWRDEHPLGLTGLKGYTVAVTDMDQALEDFQAVFDNEVVYEEARPAVSGTAVGLRIADAVLELTAPDGDGSLQQHLVEHCEGIRSTVFGVRDLDQARSYFRDRGVELEPGTAPDALAIPAEQNRGVIFEFSE